jgi:hypothetical protein
MRLRRKCYLVLICLFLSLISSICICVLARVSEDKRVRENYDSVVVGMKLADAEKVVGLEHGSMNFDNYTDHEDLDDQTDMDVKLHSLSEYYHTHLQELRNLPPMPGLVDKIDLTERFMLLDAIMRVAHQPTPTPEGLSRPNNSPPDAIRFRDRLFTRSFNWDPALQNANRW